MGQNVINRIKQMMAKAESTEFGEEADAIMEMVGKLLQAHGISLMEVKHQAHELDPVAVDQHAYGFYAADMWARKVSDAAARYYGVQVIWFRERNYTRCAIAGRESCRAAFTAMMPYLCGQVKRLAYRQHKNGAFRSQSVAATQIGTALAFRLYALARKRKETETPRQASGMNMLVPVDQVEAVVREAFPNLKMINLHRRAAVVTQHAVDCADSISLAEQLNGERRLLK